MGPCGFLGVQRFKDEVMSDEIIERAKSLLVILQL